MKRLCLIFTLILSCLCAEKQNVSERLPVDITFLFIDIKYNQQQGVKICEIQRASDSGTSGFAHVFGGTELLAQQFSEVLSQYFETKWINMASSRFRNALYDIGCLPIQNLAQLFENPLFLKKSSLPVGDRYNLKHYHGVACIRGTMMLGYSLEQFQKNYPGIIEMGAAAFPYTGDKYREDLLFLNNEASASIKPRWNLYEKKYKKSLAESIINDLRCDLFVIKPRCASGGYGVIIVNKNDLDNTLKRILNDSKTLKNNPDRSYNYWVRDHSDSFIVEEFIESDPLTVPHLDNHLYDPTIRLPIILIYNQKKIHIKLLTGFCKLPKKSLSKKGSLNDRHKSCLKLPYYCEVPPTVQTAIEQQLSEALIPVYQQMLGIDE